MYRPMAPQLEPLYEVTSNISCSIDRTQRDTTQQQKKMQNKTYNNKDTN